MPAESNPAESDFAARTARVRAARVAHAADQPGPERLLALSDGVVAIALTLLVLQLRVPDLSKITNPDSAAELAHQLAGNGGQLISYFISYYVIAHFWLAHFRVFRFVSAHREGLAWWNFAFLFTITVMPFTSSLMGDFTNNPLAVDIFAFNLLLASLATQATLMFGHRSGVISPEARAATQYGQARSIAVVAVVAVSIGVAWVDTSAAKYCWILIPVAQLGLTRRLAHHRPGAGDVV